MSRVLLSLQTTYVCSNEFDQSKQNYTINTHLSKRRLNTFNKNAVCYSSNIRGQQRRVRVCGGFSELSMSGPSPLQLCHSCMTLSGLASIPSVYPRKDSEKPSDEVMTGVILSFFGSIKLESVALEDCHLKEQKTSTMCKIVH